MTTPLLAQTAATFVIGVALMACLSLQAPTQYTSLRGAWNWGVAAQLTCFASSFSSCLASPEAPLLDQMWFWTGILVLCPLICALGAQRPASRVWVWFIVVPLVAVLGWPALTVISHWPELVPLRVQSPVLLSFCLVTLMGVGNYVGTRFTFPAVLAGMAVFFCLLPVTTLVELSPANRQFFRAAAGLLMGMAVLTAIRQGMREGSEESRFDRLWFDFRDMFGIVWSLRIQDRLNQTAEKEGWRCRLGPEGFEWDPRSLIHEREETEARLEHTLRWLLRRFVDPEWIETRLAPAAVSHCTGLPKLPEEA